VSTPDQAYGSGARPFAAGGATATAETRGTARPTTSAGTRPAPRPGPRKVRLTLGKVDPWSVMKMGFLLSVAIGIAFVVLVAVLWTILNSMGVFSDVNRTVGTVLGSSSGTQFNLMDYIGFGRVVSLATVIGVIDVFLLTALATLAAFLYNVCAQLVGGVQMTLTDD
jgi:nitrogen fixation-related uncharacterized protein